MTDALFTLDLKVDDYLESLGRARQANSAWDVNLKEVAQRGTQYLQRYFDFLRKGSAESTRALTTLEGRFDSLTEKVASAANESGPVKGFIGSLDTLTASAGGSSMAIDVLGGTLGALLTPLGNIIHMADMAAAALRRIPGVGVVASSGRGPGIGSRAAASERARVGALGDFPIASARNEPGANVVLGEEEIFGVVGGAGGGGGGGDDFGRLVMERFNAQMAAQRAYEDASLQEAKAFEERRLEDIKSAADAEKEVRLGALEETLAAEQSVRNKALEEQDRRRRQDFEDRREQFEALTASVQGYTAATMQAGVAAALEGKDAEGVARAAIAALSMRAGTEALMETAAGVGALATTWGVPNPSATGHFISAGLYGAIALAGVGIGKAAFGSNFGRASNGSRGGGEAAAGAGIGGGGFAGGGGGGGGRSTSITINMGPGLSSSSDVRRAVMRAIVEEADHGRPLPRRAVDRR